MQEKDANEWAKTIAPLQPNFISECFWLTAYYLHLGVNRAIVKYSENGTHMREIKRQISEIERAKPFPAHLAPQYDVLLARLKVYCFPLCPAEINSFFFIIYPTGAK